MFHRPSLMLASLLVTSAAQAGTLSVASVTASSTYTEQTGYGAEKVVDGKQGSAWVEGEDGSGLGAWLEIDLGGEKTIQQIRLWAGDWSSWDYWNRANRPKDLELKFADGTTQVITLKDEKVPQTFTIDGGGKKTTSLRIKLKSTYSGTTWLDTGISELQLIGPEGEGRPQGTATASSTAPEDGDGNYGAGNAVDGLNDSMWCEGDKAGDGTGQWLVVDLGKPQAISKMHLMNGIGSSMALWMKANTATGLTLQFDDGTSVPLTIERPSPRPVDIEFPAHTTQKVKITFTGVKVGKEFNDLCVSEVGFSG